MNLRRRMRDYRVRMPSWRSHSGMSIGAFQGGRQFATSQAQRGPKAMSSEDDLIPVFTPALVALLIQAEELNGSPLTRDQVIAIRDNADCVMLPRSAKAEMEEERGYTDIDPERCWEDWSIVRAKLSAA